MIYLFNPSCEMAVRTDNVSYSPPKTIEKMESDLSNIVMMLAGGDDCVVAPAPDSGLVDFWFPSGGPAFVSQSVARSRVEQGEGFAPWGLSRAVLHRYGLSDRAKAWDWRGLLSRRTSVLLEQDLNSSCGHDLFLSDSHAMVAESFDEAQVFVSKHKDVVLKSLWSASGRGVRFFSADQADLALDFAQKTISSDGAVVCECRLLRRAELSYLFRVQDDGQVDFEGINVYRSSSSGSFGLEVLGPNSTAEFDACLGPGWLMRSQEALARSIRKVLHGAGYVGPIGIDSMLYQTEGGLCKLRLCMEANLRFCMGHIGLALARRLAPGVSALWRMEHFAHDDDWVSFCDQKSRVAPAILSSDGLVEGGFFRLSPLSRSQRFAIWGECVG